jgi:hypothetical protein
VGEPLAAVALVVALAVLPFLPDGGLRDFYDTTLGFHAGRESPFSIWGQEPGLGWLRVAIMFAVAGLAIIAAFIPRRRSPAQIAALSAMVLIAVQLSSQHWFYLYIPWFAGPTFAAIAAASRRSL